MALNEYGKDFIKIARILGTKSESIVRDFYNKYNDKYDLDAFIGYVVRRLNLCRNYLSCIFTMFILT